MTPFETQEISNDRNQIPIRSKLKQFLGKNSALDTMITIHKSHQKVFETIHKSDQKVFENYHVFSWLYN